MYRIVNLSHTGLFVAIRNGAVTSVAGRLHWASAEEARSAVKAANAPAAERILTTAL